MMYPFLRSLLFGLPPEAAHRLAMRGLRALGAAQRSGAVRLLGAGWDGGRVERLPAPGPSMSVGLAGISFDHPVALAAGFDKDAEGVAGLASLGFSAIEVGTVTPRPQHGNAKPRLFRLPEEKALINRMGFNGAGLDVVAERLAAAPRTRARLGANIGKNKVTPLELADRDYVECAGRLAPLVDYLVINLSSPNTPGLRSLQAPDRLRGLLEGVRSHLEARGASTPLFVKVAPDLQDDELELVVDVALDAGMAGLVATNTTVTRPIEHRRAQEKGGLSGAPLAPRALEVLRLLRRRAGRRLALVASGGIFTGQDAYERIRAGASLVQLYTGFIYRGPGAPRSVLQELTACVAHDGWGSVSQAIGADVD